MTKKQPYPETPAAPESAALRAILMKRSSYASVVVASLLISIKLWAWLYIGSVALLGALVDSMLDLLASLATLFAIHQAVEPADREHRFGHGKVEAIAAIGQASIIMASAIFLAQRSFARLIEPEIIANGGVGIAVLVASIFLTIFLVRYQVSVARRTGSLAVSADSFHYRSDLIMNFAVIVAIGLTQYLSLTYADPLIGLGIAVYIGYNAFSIAREAYDMLMDREMPDADRLAIKTITLAQARVKNLHDLRTRKSGFNQFIQMHIELDPELKLKEAHEICDAVEADIQKAYPDAEILIHADPVGVDETPTGFEAGLSGRL